MTRRRLWTALGAVIAILAAASLLPRYGDALVAWARVHLDSHGALAAVLVVMAGGGGLAGLLRRRRPAPEPEVPFALHLRHATHAAVPHQGARRRDAEAMARAGVPAEEIARATRLSRDAVRGIEATVAAERHELPPRTVPAAAR